MLGSSAALKAFTIISWMWLLKAQKSIRDWSSVSLCVNSCHIFFVGDHVKDRLSDRIGIVFVVDNNDKKVTFLSKETNKEVSICWLHGFVEQEPLDAV